MSSAKPGNEENKEQDPLAPEDIPTVEGGDPESIQIPEGEEAVREDTQAETQAVDPDMDYPRVVDALRNELNTTKDQMMRALAEAENARKRAQKDREDASKFAISGFAKDLLSVADNLRRALDAVPEDVIESDERIKNLMGGIEATERELLRSFEKNSIEKIDPKDQPFDPNFHEVMFEAPGTGKPSGTVVEVIETGYTLNGRLLRPARVGVAKDDGSAPSGDPEPGAQIDTEA